MTDRPEISHRDGVSWVEAPIPPAHHDCAVQTRGSTRSGALVERCACGAIRLNGSPWMERNSRPGPVEATPARRRWWRR